MQHGTNLEKKYGLITTICLIVGAVIGSGIFFLNETIFAHTGGNLYQAVLAWLVGGGIMFVMMWVWGKLATEKDGMGGLMEYTDELLGKAYSYYLGWFLATIHYPAFVAILAWVSARFTATLLGWEMVNASGEVWMLAGVYLVFMYVVNVISPKIAGHLQVSTTFIKVIPLLLMGIVGVIFGLANDNYTVNMATTAVTPVASPIFYAIIATVFAYAGSEEVLMMSSEIKNVKKNLPRATVIGSLLIIGIYVAYTIGVYGAYDVSVLATAGGVTAAFNNVFGSAMGTILTVFIIISCLGAMNSAMMAGTRSFYALAIRGRGPAPDYVRTRDAKTDMPPTSSALFLLFSGIIFFIVFANATDMANYPYQYHARWFGNVNFAISSLAPVSLMAFYVPIFFRVMQKKKEWNVFNRFVMPGLSILGGLAMIYMVFYTNAIGAMLYLGFFAVIMLVGFGLDMRNRSVVQEKVQSTVGIGSDISASSIE